MNFLAHALLAGNDPALIVGGVVGDWIKGPLPGPLPPDLARGVALHRAIDSHAETHPAFQRSRNRVAPDRRRYAGILVDIFYDHLLARDWASLQPMPLADEAQVQAIAKSAGVDWSKVEAKIKDGSIDQNLGTNRALAEAMSISGTPGFIIGDQILRGAPRDLASLKAIVKDVRAGKSIQ